MRYEVTLKRVEALNATGAATVRIDSVKGPRLRIVATGSSTVTGRALDLERPEVVAAGASSLSLAGQAGELALTLSGTGSYEGRKLESKRARVVVSGVGSANVAASESIDAQVSGTGSIDVGPAKGTRSISG